MSQVTSQFCCEFYTYKRPKNAFLFPSQVMSPPLHLLSILRQLLLRLRSQHFPLLHQRKDIFFLLHSLLFHNCNLLCSFLRNLPQPPLRFGVMLTEGCDRLFLCSRSSREPLLLKL